MASDKVAIPLALVVNHRCRATLYDVGPAILLRHLNEPASVVGSSDGELTRSVLSFALEISVVNTHEDIHLPFSGRLDPEASPLATTLL
jgi:hypothetical protein